MQRPTDKRERDKKYYVAAPLGTSENCIVYGPGEVVPGNYQELYGPDTKDNCERWKQRYCKK